MDIRSNNSNFELFIKLEWLLCKKESIRGILKRAYSQMGTSLGTRNKILKWIFVQIILILKYLSDSNGFVAKKNQLGNFKKSIFTNENLFRN